MAKYKNLNRLIIAVVVILVAILSFGCVMNVTETINADPDPLETYENALENAPSLEVILIANNSTKQQVQAIQLTTSWMFVDKNGIGKAYNSDSAHPLQIDPNDFNKATLSLDNTNSEIEMLFSDNYPPQTISVERWPAEYASGNQDISDVIDKGEPTLVSYNLVA